jgi:type I restriction enzyme S subunit
MNNKKIVKLSDISEIIPGFAFKSEDFGNEGETVVKIKDISPPFIITVNADRVNFKKYNRDKLVKYRINKGDFVVAMTGATIGKVGKLINEETCYINQRVAKINPKEGVSKEFVYYTIQRKLFVEFILTRLDSSSAQGNISADGIGEFQVPSYSKDTQQKIASVLSALDSKIELNNRINAELEAMAKTLYDYWFVQFDFPDANGKPYKSSGGKMVWNEGLKREIPDLEGWSVGTLLDIADYANGLPCQKFRPTGDDVLRVIKIREMNEGFSANTELVRPNIPPKSIIENGDVLFSWSASLEVKIWTGGKGALNQHIFKVTSIDYPKSFYYYQLLNYLKHFKMMAENRKTTMGHITQDHLQQSRIVIPPKELTKVLDKIIAPIFSKKINNEIENQKLIELRDWLLPMLMNGQVKVGVVGEEIGRIAAEPVVKLKRIKSL